MFRLAFPLYFDRHLWLQRDFLNAPPGDLGGHNFIGISAVHGVHGGEFLSLLARLAKFAEDGAIQLHLVDFTGDGKAMFELLLSGFELELYKY